MPNPYFTNNTDLLPNTRARAGDVESKLEAVEAGFDGVDAAITGVNSSKAPINSPVFTGDPRAPTPPDGDNDTSLATTAFTHRAIGQAAAINLPPATGNDGKVLGLVSGVPAWVFSGLVYSEVTGTTANIAKGEHKALRNAAATTITAPPSASPGDLWALSVENGRSDNVINWNGLKHMGLSDATTTIDAQFATIFCEYHGTTFGWKIY